MNMYDALQYLNSIGIELNEKQYLENSHKKVIVGLSGGVDSSVSAQVLKLMGFETIGIFMKNWEETDDSGQCTSEIDAKDAQKIAEQVGIPYYSLNFVEEYRENVFQYFLDEYKKGHTPNPDILCNREIKFKVFYEKAMELGADYLATGHYCQHKEVNGQDLLVKGVDQDKDQTYFLYTMQANVLKNVLFPIGHLEKPTVRKIAEDFKLATAAKKDSTGICFIGERNFKEFLSQYIKSQQGDFVHLDSGKVLGPHDGHSYYTNGQRKGLGLGGPGGPWFVVDKDIEKNIVYVVEGDKHPALYADELYAFEESWVNERPTFPLKCSAKIRYRQKDQTCTVYEEGDKLKVIFDSPQRAISPRQSIVFYQEDICLGGAVIEKSGANYFEMNKTLP
jgi:tRNA-specific 2-thiouridylase